MKVLRVNHDSIQDNNRNSYMSAAEKLAAPVIFWNGMIVGGGLGYVKIYTQTHMCARAFVYVRDALHNKGPSDICGQFRSRAA